MQKEKLNQLVAKYNDILRESMHSAVAEDLVNLIIVNGDDKDFELQDLISKKADFKEYVFREFMRINAHSVASELKNMDERKIKLVKAKQRKLKL